ncbi:HNH endonuclease [Bacillus phage Silence]|nr:HNH endonuclease [Bacillus phage Silence]
MKETNYKGYFVDKAGNVWSSKRKELTKLSPQSNGRGYLQVTLSTNEKTRTKLVHRLVAETFLGTVNNLTVNHKDGDKTNNSLENLEIVSQKINNRHSWEIGLSKKGEKHSRAKISDEKLILMIKDIEGGLSTVKAARKYNLSQSYVSKVMRKIYRQDIWSKM